MTKILVFSFVRQGPFRFALFFDRFKAGYWEHPALLQIFSIVPLASSKSAESFRTWIMAILIYVAEVFWR